VVVERQLQRYFVGLVGFGFVVAWATVGPITAVLAVGACAALVAGPQYLGRRRRAARPRPVRARPLTDEAESLPLVPDEPSLILELG
jgi:O-antigen/teichoic acid export membrane protein